MTALKKTLHPFAAALAVFALTSPAAAFDEADALFGKLTAWCGKAFEGKVVTTDPRDNDMAGAKLVMHVATCDAKEIRIPFHVGEDRSRTWVVTRTDKGLRLKHDHRHEDGSPDAVTMYGGDSTPPGTDQRQEFPADAETKAMFLANDLAVSVDNIWAIEVEPGKVFAYELNRENRHFRIEFDLTKPLADIPPPPWGDK